jgi:transcriptional regulator with GAF, ATPase, and Fis domain
VTSALAAGRPAFFNRLEDLPDSDRAEVARIGLWSMALTPVTIAPGVAGALAVGSSARDMTWTPALLHQLRIAAALVAHPLARQSSTAALESARAEINQLRDRLSEERSPSRPSTRMVRLSRPIVSEGTAIKQALMQVEQVAPTPATVLLLGETGVGKEVFAQAIHDMSPRHNRPMIRVSCAAIPSALIESELFGRERGAYTGALTRQIGRFEAANGSTIFLDEIGDLSAEVQIKLLRVLQERVIERLGSTQSVKVDVRIIAATNRNLEKAVQDRTFREDLFYRLNVFPIEIPPLRERVEDISSLVWEFVDEFSKSFGKTIESVDKASMEQLERYAWPGNVRELRNLVERAMIVANGPRLIVAVPQSSTPVARTSKPATLRELELEHIRATLDATNWRVRGRRGAAERLGLKPTTLEGRMAKLGLARPKS